MPKLSLLCCCESKVNSDPHCPSGSSCNLDAIIVDGCTHIPTATSFMILFLIPRKNFFGEIDIFAVMKSFANQVKRSLHKTVKMILRKAALRLRRLQQLQHISTIATPLPTVTSRIIGKVELLTIS